MFQSLEFEVPSNWFYLLSVLNWPRTNTMEFPSKIYVQIVIDNMKYGSNHLFALGIAKLWKYNS